MNTKHLFILLSLLGFIFIYACEELEDGSDPKPEIDFTFQATDSTKMTIKFTNNTVNAFTYSWKFGDGETSTQTSPTHTYLANGSYDVQLSAAGDGGNNSLTKTIVIPLQ